MVKSLPLEGVRYLPLNAVLSFNRPVTFVISSKGDGKSIHAQLWRVNQFLRFDARTLWLRRYDKDTERGALEGFFSNLDMLLKQGQLHCYGNKAPSLTMEWRKGLALGKVNGKTAFTIVSVNVGGKLLGTGVPDQPAYDCVVFDECLINPAIGEKELPAIVDKYRRITATFFRDRPYRQLFLGNPYTTASPWFDEYEHIDLRKIRFNAVTAPKGKPWAFYYGVPAKHLQESLNSSYAKSAPLTAIDKSGIYGLFYLDDTPLIISPKATAKTYPLVNFSLNGVRYGLWNDLRNGWLTVSTKPCPDQMTLIPIETDGNRLGYLISSQRRMPWFRMLVLARQYNAIRYESAFLLRSFVPLWEKWLK